MIETLIHFLKDLFHFSKSLVPYLCSRVDSKGITFESYESAGEFTLANQIFLTFHFLRHFLGTLFGTLFFGTLF